MFQTFISCMVDGVSRLTEAFLETDFRPLYNESTIIHTEL
jgi:hypothetical protein